MDHLGEIVAVGVVPHEGEIGLPKGKGQVQAQGGQNVLKLAVPLRLKLRQGQGEKFRVRPALQNLSEGIPVQAVQPDFKFSALLRHQGEESQPSVVVGEDRPLSRLALEIGKGDETGVQKIHGFLVAPLVVKPPKIGVVGVKLRLPSVFQVEGIHQQQGGVFVERLREDSGDHPVGVVRHPAVYRRDHRGGGQLLGKHLGVEDAPALPNKVLPDHPLRVGPQAVGDETLCGAAQVPVVGEELGAGGVQLLQGDAAPQNGFKLSQGIPGRSVGRHGERQGCGEGREENGTAFRLPGTLEQGKAEAGQGLVHGRTARWLNGHRLGGELLGLDRRSGRSAAGQESKGQGESEGQCKGAPHRENLLFNGGGDLNLPLY